MSNLVLFDRAVFQSLVLVAIPLNGYGWTWNVRYGWVRVGESTAVGSLDFCTYYGFFCSCGLHERKGLRRLSVSEGL